MIAEPYICTKGNRAGEIMWCIIESTDGEGSEICHQNCKDGCTFCAGGDWQSYTDFEREKLKELGCERSGRGLLLGAAGYEVTTYNKEYVRERNYTSDTLIGYIPQNYYSDSESSRLLKRAEFLKAVCEKEGVVWLVPPTPHAN